MPRLALGVSSVALAALLVVALLAPRSALAMPEFARRYNFSCSVCHDAFPRLNAFGESFAAMNYKLPNWRDANTLPLGDERLALPERPPLALRMQAYVQGREGEDVDPLTGPTGNDSGFDFQAPYLIKLLSSSPLSENITYYFYGIFAEKGGNGEALIEDAWFRHGNLLGKGIGMQLGQFQVSDLMFPREVRLTFQDFYAYRAAGITYDRGVLFDRAFGRIDVALGAVNGNGINANFDIDSPGYRRPDALFDNDSRKSVFGRVAFPAGRAEIGVFALDGEQRSASGFAGASAGARDTDKRILGLDVRGSLPNGRAHWFAQWLRNDWDGFLDAAPQRDFDWSAGFVGLDYVRNDRWSYSVLYNYADADDFEGTGTIYEGIDMSSLTLNASYYFMRNLKTTFEVNFDLLGDRPGGPPFVGHQSKEHYLLVGFDMAL
ncbi:MAG TPA: hypothetical protein VF322_03580 [Gammaproteobacteria bacterium]